MQRGLAASGCSTGRRGYAGRQEANKPVPGTCGCVRISAAAAPNSHYAAVACDQPRASTLGRRSQHDGRPGGALCHETAGERARRRRAQPPASALGSACLPPACTRGRSRGRATTPAPPRRKKFQAPAAAPRSVAGERTRQCAEAGWEATAWAAAADPAGGRGQWPAVGARSAGWGVARYLPQQANDGGSGVARTW